MGNQPSDTKSKDSKNVESKQQPPILDTTPIYLKVDQEFRALGHVKETERSSGFFSSLTAQERLSMKAVPLGTSVKPTPMTISKKAQGSSGEKTVLVTIPYGCHAGQTFMTQLPNGKRMRVQVPQGGQPGSKLRVTYVEKGQSAQKGYLNGDKVILRTRMRAQNYSLIPNPKEKKGDQRLIWSPISSESKSTQSSELKMCIHKASTDNTSYNQPLVDGDVVSFYSTTDANFGLRLENNFLTLAPISSQNPPQRFTVHRAYTHRSTATSGNSNTSQGQTPTTTGTNATASASNTSSSTMGDVAAAGILGTLAATAVSALARHASTQNLRRPGIETAMIAAAATTLAPTIARVVDSRYANNPLQILNDISAVSRVMGTNDFKGMTQLVNGQLVSVAAGAMATGGVMAMSQGGSNSVNRRTTGNRKGFDEDTINRFPTTVLARDTEDSCVICMDKMGKGDTVRRLPCFHVFHKE